MKLIEKIPVSDEVYEAFKEKCKVCKRSLRQQGAILIEKFVRDEN